MPDTPEKRRREAQKRRNREEKSKRKQLRKDGVLGQDTSGLFAPGEIPREVVSFAPPRVPKPVEPTPEHHPGRPTLTP